MAPESLTLGKYSEKSDVWSFGVLCWEVFAREEPYGGIGALQVCFQVREGLVLDIPKGTPPSVATIMKSCWAFQSSDRPTFSELLPRIIAAENSLHET